MEPIMPPAAVPSSGRIVIPGDARIRAVALIGRGHRDAAMAHDPRSDGLDPIVDEPDRAACEALAGAGVRITHEPSAAAGGLTEGFAR